MKHLLLGILLHLLGLGAHAQASPGQNNSDLKSMPPGIALPTPALPPGVTISDAAFPFPLEERDKIRDLQHENDSIEIENQKMLVKIEQNKARQAALVDQMRLVALDFAERKKISLAQYELDPSQIKFVKKKPQ